MPTHVYASNYFPQDCHVVCIRPEQLKTSMNTVKSIRVLLVDDESLVRRVLRQILAQYPDIDIVGEAATGVEAVSAVKDFQPEVVLMDIRMPRMDGITAAREIKAQHPHVKIIGLSEYAEGYQAHAMELAGAAGLI